MLSQPVTHTLMAQTAPHMLVREGAGVIALTDADRVDFLQRMTTNDIARLKPGEAAVTILTSPVAKIVHVFTVLAREDALWLLPAPGESGALARHLRGQIFFLDKVKVQEVDAEWRRVRVVGNDAAKAIQKAGLALPTQDDRWVEGEGVLVLAQARYEIAGYELVVPADRFDATLNALGGAGVGIFENQAEYEALRVAAGRPAPGAELTGEYSPLEVGMEWACAEDKGCYTGQEIIARQRTYDKVTRTLVKLRSGSLLEAGAPLVADGREVGKVTSAAVDPDSGEPIALGVVKRPHNAGGSRLLAGNTAVEVVEIG